MSAIDFRAVFDLLPLPAAVVGLDTRILEANPALCALFGRPREDLIGHSWLEIVRADHAEASRDGGRVALLEGAPVVTAIRPWVRADGSVRWLRGLMRLHRDPDGRPLHFVVQAVDVTDELAAAACPDALTLERPVDPEKLVATLQRALARGPSGDGAG
ncbi:MAG: PAS domain-containing protein [Myxococcota bacterium]